jgi:diguanylate cyclase (GGDEF)-like protein
MIFIICADTARMKLNAGRYTADWGLVPFAGATAIAWLTVPIGSSIDWSQYALSVGLLGMVESLAVSGMLRARAPWLRIVPNALLFLVAVALLRNSAGGINSSAGGLSLIPVFYTALYSRSRRDLFLVLAGVAIFYVAPILIVGAPAYPQTQYRAAGLSVMIAAIIGLATQQLVADVRRRAAESRSRERMLEQVAAVVRGLLGSSQARGDVCEAAREISQATVAILFEPAADGQTLRSTAMAGIDAPARDIADGDPSGLREAFDTGTAKLVTEDVERQVGSHELWEAAGRPQSVLYQPLLRMGKPLGVLIVAWSGGVMVDTPRATVVALLAHEAATVIQRADELDALADQAQTDPLTGLPNRRAWDVRLGRATNDDDRLFTVAMIDFDHFKEFNDTYGHPAGDRLLKEASAAWREQLRGGDLLARLGGEEFGLLLVDTGREQATVVIERLRECIPSGRTCSAGIAVRRGSELPDAVIARADRALYEAKQRGRDRACVSV